MSPRHFAYALVYAFAVGAALGIGGYSLWRALDPVIHVCGERLSDGSLIWRRCR